jgi:hypothetical protein
MSTNDTKNLNPSMTLEQVRVAFLELLAQEDTNHHAMGQLYNDVVDRQLAENAGYSTALDFFSKHVKDLSRATLVSYGAVARNFTATVCTQFGVSRLSLLLTYKEAAGIQLNADELGGTLIEVPDDDGALVSKPFSQCSVKDLRKALQRKRRPTSSKPLPQEDLSLVEHYRKAVTGRFPTETPVRVSVRNLGGEAVISFKDIPLAQVDALTEALLDGTPPLRVAG